MRFNSRRLLAISIIAWMGWGGQADARPVRVTQIPNGSCGACHVDPNGRGALTAFGDEINKNYLMPSGRLGRVNWNAALAMLDSDGDGVSNGRELGDPDGDGTPDPSIEVTNPGDRTDFVQQPGPSVGPPAVVSLVIGGVPLEENATNPPVSSGMLSFEVTFDKPLRAVPDLAGDSELDVPVVIYPLPDSVAAWAISADSLKLTASIQLSENAIYQLIVGNPPAQQQYFFGTVALPDAVVSGRATFPADVKLTAEPGSAVLMDSDAYSKAYSNLLSLDDSDDPAQLLATILDEFLPTIIRIDPFDILESLPKQLAFELKYVPDGSYILALYQNAIDAKGDTIELSAFRGIDAMGQRDSATLIRVAGESVTNLQIALQTDVEPEAIIEVRVDRIDAEKNLFFVRRDGRQVTVSVTVAKQGDDTGSETLLFTTTDTSPDPNDIFSQLEQGMFPGIHVFSFDQLMVGDTISVLGLPSSDDAMQALFVLRHESPAVMGDLNDDGMVNFSDFLLFAAAFGKGIGDDGYDPKADLNGDGEVNFTDFILFARNFGN